MAVRRIPTWQAGIAFWALVAAIIAIRRSGVGNQVDLATFGLVFTSIAVEALPFVLLGAIVSAAMAVYVPDRAFARIARLPPRLQVPGLALCGFAFPVCECGSVPVGRRLIERGVHPAGGVAFMLAAPILNPIVLVSTYVAYGGGGRGAQVVAGRAGIGLVTAIVAGFALDRGDGVRIRERAAEHDHDHSHRRGAFAEHLADDFLLMGRFLVLGAALSAALQTFVPQSLTNGVAGTFVIGTLALMGLAFMLSLCSEADAFVATSFVGFSLPAQIAFLAFGPILDTKLAVLYGATFGRRFVPRLLAVSVPCCLVGSLLFGAVT